MLLCGDDGGAMMVIRGGSKLRKTVNSCRYILLTISWGLTFYLSGDS
jgi:hypothetical protein